MASRTVTFDGVSIPFTLSHRSFDELTRVTTGLAPDRIVVVTDDTVWGLHGARLETTLAAVAPVLVLSAPAGEGEKTLARLCAHLERASEWGATRRSLVVTFGGGVPGNLGGLVATLLFRGLRFIHVPTTLMALTDSTLSLKQAVNGARGKNLFGSFRVPDAIIADSALLETLPAREIRSGLCELIKNAIAIAPHTLGELRDVLRGGRVLDGEALERLLTVAIDAKLGVMKDDRLEQRTGVLLEYGHTVGHAIELCDHRLRGSEGLSHGEAVGLGMRVAARIALRRGLLTPAIAGLHDELLDLAGVLPTLPPRMTIAEILGIIANDNKRGHLAGLRSDQAAMILLAGLGVPAGRRECPLVAVGFDEIAQELASVLPTATSEAA